MPSQYYHSLEHLNWIYYLHLSYSPDMAPSDYHLFRSMAHGLAGLPLANFEEVQNWLMKDFVLKSRYLCIVREWQKCVASKGEYFK